jgi:ABC-2 type transport system permease protein
MAQTDPTTSPSLARSGAARFQAALDRLTRLRLVPNPIVVKELRSRMRGARAFSILTAVLLVLGGASYVLYRIVLTTSRYSSMPLSPQIGQALFVGLGFLELMMVAFVTPAVTAGAVSGEQEKQTYEMLLATPLRPGAILRGKLVASLGYVFLLIFAAVPMASIVFIFGGVAPRELLKALAVVTCVAVMLGIVGVFFSAWLGRTTRATVASYLFVLALLVLPYVAYILSGVIEQREPPRWLLLPSPISALASAVAPANQGVNPSGVLGQFGWILGGGISLARGAVSQVGPVRPLYHYTLPLYGALSLALYLLSARLVRPTQRWRLRWREVVGATVLLIAFAALVGGGYLLTRTRYPSAGLTSRPVPTPAPVRVASPRVAIAVEEAQVVPAPTPTPETPPGGVPGEALSLDDADRAAIYAAVVHQLYWTDHTHDVAPEWDTLYLLETTDDSDADPNLPHSDPETLPDAVREELVRLLDEDVPARVEWVADPDASLDSQGATREDSALIVLGDIHAYYDDVLAVAGSVDLGGLGAGGRTYTVTKADGTWQITGDTGAVWFR